MTSTSTMLLAAPPRAMAPRASARNFRAQRAVPSRRRARVAPVAAAAESPPASESAPPSVARSLEFMVEMSCGKCVASVERACAAVPGVEAVVANLSANTVRVVATAAASADDVDAAVTAAGYKCRLVGQGALEMFGEDLAARLGTNLRTLHQSLAAVAEFKGEDYGHGSVAGVVRFVQVDEETCMVEGRVSGLVPGASYAATVRAFGDVTRGVESVGPAYELGGELGVVEADARGDGVIASRVVDERLKVWDIIGRAVAVAPADGGGAGVAAVLARSAGMGDNLKQQCACDGTVIWESSHDDFKPERRTAADGGKNV